MSIFPNLKIEPTVQVNDKTRIDARDSFVSKDEGAVTKVEIQTEATGSFVDVTGSSSQDWYLDWEYSTTGTKAVVVRITTDGSPVTKSGSITIISEADDKLLCQDSQLVVLEPDILKYIPEGRNTYKNVHREVLTRILDWLNEKGYTDVYGAKYTKDAIIGSSSIEEFRSWAKYMAFRLIFEDISNATDDIFRVKAKNYEAYEVEARNKLVLRIDIDDDGAIDTYENLPINCKLRRD